MWHRLAQHLFSPVDAMPLTVFRIILVLGLALHFLPATFAHRSNYAHNIVRFPVILPELGEFLVGVPGSMQVTHIVFVLALVGAATLRATRLFFSLIVLCLYVYLSVNALNTNTLGLWPTLNICTLFAVLPSGNPRYTLSPSFIPGIWFGSAPRLLPVLILIQVLGAFFFAGLEKLLAGWYASDPMKEFLSLPSGSIVRPWVYSLFSGGVPGFLSVILTIATLTGEIVLPVMAIFRKYRSIVFLSFEIFFAGVMLVLDIPPLFYLIFAGGALLLLTRDAPTGK